MGWVLFWSYKDVRYEFFILMLTYCDNTFINQFPNLCVNYIFLFCIKGDRSSLLCTVKKSHVLTNPVPAACPTVGGSLPNTSPPPSFFVQEFCLRVVCGTFHWKFFNLLCCCRIFGHLTLPVSQSWSLHWSLLAVEADHPQIATLWLRFFSEHICLYWGVL